MNFKIQIYSPGAEGCLLYEEDHNGVNMAGSAGLFALPVGKGSRSAGNFEDSSTIKQILNNAGGSFTPTVCAVGGTYTPLATDNRKLRLTFNDGSGAVTIAQDLNIQSVPYAQYADSVGGLSASEILQVNGATDLNQTALETIFAAPADTTELRSLIDGTSSNYMVASPAASVGFNNQRVTDVATPTAGTDAANKNYVDGNLGGNTISTGVLGAGETGEVLTWNGTQWVAQTLAAAGDILDGGNTTGAAVTVGTNDAFNLVLETSNTPAVTIDATQGVSLAAGLGVTGGVNAGGNVSLLAESELRLEDAAGGEYMALKAPATVTANTTLTLPDGDGGANQVLATDGSGQLIWATDADTDAVDTVFGRSGTVAAAASDYDANQVDNTPAGDIAATDVQGAIDELDGDKVAKAGDTMTGNLNLAAQSELRLQDDAGGEYIGLKAPTGVTNYVMELPPVVGASGQVLELDGSGNLVWASNAAGINSLNGETGGTQTFAAGTAGTDFAISSAGGVHTFNIPTASGTNRGVLASADWTTFNNKLSSSLTDGQIFVGDGSNSAAGVAVSGDATITNAGVVTVQKLQNRDVAATLPTDTQVLKWNNGGSTWEPAADLVLTEVQVDAYANNNGYAADADVLKKDGSVALTGDMSAGTNTITNLGAPSAAADAATKGYVDGEVTTINSSISGKVAIAGDTMTGALNLAAENEVRFQDNAGGEYMGLKAPATVTASTTLTLPDGAGASGQVLETNGVGVLSWATPTTGTGDFLADGSIPMTGNLQLNGGSNLVLQGATSGTVSLLAPATVTSYVMELPNAAGTVGQVLKADASGNLVWGADDDTADTDTTYTADGDGIELSTTTFGLELDGTTLSKSGTGLKVNEIGNSEVAAAAAIARTKLANGTANRILVNDGSGVMADAAAITPSMALVSDANGIPVADAGVTVTELGYVNGVTSAIQTQIDSKQANLGYTAVDVDGDNMTGNLQLDGGSNLILEGATSGTVSLLAPATVTSYVMELPDAAGTTGQVLKADASGNLTWATDDSGGAGDFLADGSIPMTGDLNLDTNSLLGGTAASGDLTLQSTSDATKGDVLINPTGGNVGVGTTSASTVLDVRNSANSSTTLQVVNTDAGSSAEVNFRATTDAGSADFGMNSVADGGEAYVWNVANTDLIMATNNLQRMAIKADGDIGIGTNTPEATALVDMYSTTKGALIPRMTTAQRDAIVTPADGLQIYNTTTSQLNYYNSSAWQALGIAGAGLTTLNTLTGSSQSFAPGTAGTDFGISSVGSTHTFNIPTASGTNRGALASADWTTFNDKLTSTLADGQIFVGDGSNDATAVAVSGDVAMTNAGVVTVGKLQNRDVAATLPTDTQVLKWNNGGTTWEPAADLVLTEGQVDAYANNNGYAAAADVVAVAGDNMTGNLQMDGGANLILEGATSGTVSLLAPATVTSYVMELPDAAGTTGEVLKADASGNLVWGTDDSGGAGDFLADGSVPMTGNLNLQTQSELRLQDDAGGEYVGLRAPAGVTSYTMDLPVIAGTVGQVLKANASGNLVWSVDDDTADTDTTYTADGDGIELSTTTFGLELDGTTLSKSGTGLKVNEIGNSEIAAAAAIARTKLANGTANRILVNDGSGVMADAAAIAPSMALVSDANGIPVADAGVTVTELGYVNGVTSAIQTQIDSKQANLGYTPVDVAGDNMTGNLQLDGGSNLILEGATSGTVSLLAPATVTSYVMELPDAAGTTGQVLKADASGNLVWGADDAGGAGDLKADGTVPMAANFNLNNNSLIGGTASGDDVTIESTTDATKGEVLINPNGGNVGVGTTTAATLVDVRNSANSSTTMQVVNTNAGAAAEVNFRATTDAGSADFGMNSVADGGEAYVWNAANTDLIFGTNNTQKMVIRADGDVGIGTSNPVSDARMVIHEPTNGPNWLQFSNTDTGSASTDGFWVGFNNGENAALYNEENTEMQFSTNSAQRMVIQADGDLGIGTATPEVTALVDMFSTTKGALIPRMTTAQRDAITTPANGLQVYNTTTSELNYYNGSSWQALGIAGAGLTTLNTLTGSSQSFAPGTAGTDFGISSVGSTHTFNIPTASGTNRGALSSANWTTFNDKLTSTLADGQIFVGDGSNDATAVAVSGDVAMTNAGVVTVGKLQNRDVAATLPTDTQVLKWNNTGTTWEPAADLVLTETQVDAFADNNGYAEATDVVAKAGDAMTGNLVMDNEVEVQFREATGNGVNYVGFKAPALLGGDQIWTLPAADGAANQALRTTGGGVLEWYTPAAGTGDFLADGSIPMTGQLEAATGTAGAPGLSFNGDEDTGFYNSGAGEVMFASDGVDKWLFDDTDIIAQFAGGAKFGGASGASFPTYSFSDDFDTGMYSASGNELSFGTGGSQRMVVDSGGVGIGTSNSNTRLDVEGRITSGPIDATAGNTGSIILEELAAGGTDSIGLRAPDAVGASFLLTLPDVIGGANQAIRNSGTPGVLEWYTPATGTGDFLASGAVPMAGDLSLGTNSLLGGTASGNDLSLESTSDATKGDILMNVSGGNVGIGLAAPDLIGAGTVVQLHDSTAGSRSSVFRATTLGTGALQTDGVNFGYWQNAYAAIWNYENTPIVFGTNSLERARFAANGDLGIGTDGPATKLDVEGRITSGPLGTSTGETGSLVMEELLTNGTDTVGFRAPDVLAGDLMWTLPTVLGSTGQVLQHSGVAGELEWATPTTGTGDFLANGTIAMTGDLNLNTNKLLGGTGSGDNLVLESTSHATKGSIIMNAALGIGTTAPVEIIHATTNYPGLLLGTDGVSGTSGANISLVSKGGDAAGLGDASTLGWDISVAGDGNASPTTEQNDFQIKYWDGSTRLDALFIDAANQNMGIGTDAPDTKLDVLGRVTSRPIDATSGNTGSIVLRELAATGDNEVGFRAPDALAGDVIWTLPDVIGTANQVLTNSSTPGVLEWTTPTTGTGDLKSDGSVAMAAAFNLNGNSLIGGTASGDDLTLNSTSNGTKGDVFINPDSGGVVIGSSIANNSTNNALEIVGDGNDRDLSIFVYNNTIVDGPELNLNRALGSEGTPVDVSNNTSLGRITARAHDGSDFVKSASIEFLADGAAGAGDLPSRIEFYTTPDGTTTQERRMVIKETGQVGIGTALPGNAQMNVYGVVNSGSEASVLEVDGQLTHPTGTNQAALRAEVTVAPTAASSREFFGIIGAPDTTSANVASADMTGIYSSTSVGGTAAIDEVRGVRSNLGVNNTSAVDTFYGFYVDDPSGAGTIDHTYGMYIENMTKGAVSNHAIYSIGPAPSYLKGSLGIQDGTPDAYIEITSNGGSGTDYFKISTDDFGVDGDVFVVKDGGDVAIGTDTPTAKLDVNGGFSLRGIASGSAPTATAGQGKIYFDSTANTFKVSQNGGGYADLLPTSGAGAGDFLAAGTVPMTGNIRLNGNYLSNDGGSEGVHVNTDGNVGIGRAASSSKILAVEGTAQFTSLDSGPAILQYNSWDSNSAGTVGEFRRYRDDATAPGSGFAGQLSLKLEGFTDGTAVDSNEIKWGWEGAQGNDTTDRDSYMSFETTSDDTLAEKVRITSAGSVGIGTVAPGAKLHVDDGDIIVRGDSSDVFIDITGSPAFGDGAGFVFQRNGVNKSGMGGALIDDSYENLTFNSDLDNNNIGDIEFRDGNGGGVDLNMIIKNTGDVGIGTGTPQSRLSVDGAITNASAILDTTAEKDFADGNIQYTTESCGAFDLRSLKSGGSYTFIVQGATSATCSFSAYSSSDTSTALTVHLPTDHGATTVSTHTIYSIVVAGTHAYFAWSTGL